MTVCTYCIKKVGEKKMGELEKSSPIVARIWTVSAVAVGIAIPTFVADAASATTRVKKQEHALSFLRPDSGSEFHYILLFGQINT